VLDLLRSRSATVAVAESLTGGLVGAALTAVAGASAAFRGGITAYAPELKSSLLGVDPELLARHGPVHPAVAVAMAAGIRAGAAATYGLATTGVAGPEPSGGVAAGTVYVAVVGPGSQQRVQWAQFMGDRAAIRAQTVEWALGLLVETLGTEPADVRSDA